MGNKAVEVGVKFGYMDNDGNFHAAGESLDEIGDKIDEFEPDEEELEDSESYEMADALLDVLRDNLYLQGMIEAYERVLGITDDYEDEEDE